MDLEWARLQIKWPKPHFRLKTFTQESKKCCPCFLLKRRFCNHMMTLISPTNHLPWSANMEEYDLKVMTMAIIAITTILEDALKVVSVVHSSLRLNPIKDDLSQTCTTLPSKVGIHLMNPIRQLTQ
eukprot:TRINITY_DN3785_c2_g1_i2.p1 TRINITY_DN3785_c2_g1~~TRINITY_DN3785_c2_g1_i2.p1  ORF type:complete len:126 (+),score=10.69 TRINITY_DN3785_c2_g1_i2:1014-1391(+)